MDRKPISPDLHGTLDWVFAGVHLAAPSILGLRGAARTLCYGFAAAQAGLAAVTDNRRGLTRQVSMEVHGVTDLAQLPLYVALPAVTGVVMHRRARNYFAGMFVAGLATWMLTDFHTSRRLLTSGGSRAALGERIDDRSETGDPVEDDALRERQMHTF